MIYFLIIDERSYPKAQLDQEQQCNQSFKNNYLRGIDQPIYALFHLIGLALVWQNHAGKLQTLQENTDQLTKEELKGMMRFMYVPIGYTNHFNVDLGTQVLRTKVGIFVTLGISLVLNDGYHLKYVSSHVVVYINVVRCFCFCIFQEHGFIRKHVLNRN